MSDKPKPKVQLVGQDGNVFNLLGICTKALKRADQYDEAKELQNRVTSCGSYAEALSIMLDYVDAETVTVMTTMIDDIDRNNEDDAYNLLPPSLEKILPKLYATEKKSPKNKIVYAKFFATMAYWTWFVLEGSWDEDHEDFIFFGLVHGHEKEYGYFSLKELESVGESNPLYRVERDLYFTPTPLSKITEHK